MPMMVSYRAYLVEEDGSISGFQMLAARDDHHALAIAGMINQTCAVGIEVWTRARLVGRVDATPHWFEEIDVTGAHLITLAARAPQQQADMIHGEMELAKIRIARFKRVMAERAL